MSLLSCLKAVPDPRSRRRREYPHYALLAILILAAAHGETSLRGMWQWGAQRAERLRRWRPLGLWSCARFPSLGTFWYLLSKLEVGALEEALQAWSRSAEVEDAYALDGKVLRGSKRADAPALRVVTLAGHRLRHVLGQVAVEGQDELGAALRLLEAEDLEGKVVSADAGLMKAPLVQKVVKKGAPISA